MKVKIKNVLNNNEIFLKDTFNITVDEFLNKMAEVGPSSTFKKITNLIAGSRQIQPRDDVVK